MLFLLLLRRLHLLLLLRRLHVLLLSSSWPASWRAAELERLCHAGDDVSQQRHVDLAQQHLVGRRLRPKGRQQALQLLQVVQRRLQALHCGGGLRAEHLEHAADEGILRGRKGRGTGRGRGKGKVRCK